MIDKVIENAHIIEGKTLQAQHERDSRLHLQLCSVECMACWRATTPILKEPGSNSTPKPFFFSLLTFSTFLRAKEEETVFSFINAFSDLMHEGTLLALCSGVVA